MKKKQLRVKSFVRLLRKLSQTWTPVGGKSALWKGRMYITAGTAKEIFNSGGLKTNAGGTSLSGRGGGGCLGPSIP